MTEITFEIQIPTPLLQFGLERSELQRRMIEGLVLSLYSDGHVSSGRAARLLGITRIQFLSLLKARGIAYINYTTDELHEELTAAQTIEISNPL